MILELLNHACIKISYQNGIKILCDPWFEGNVFEEGWGLKYYNPIALESIRDCNYLWISHFHEDHFHISTLKQIVQLNPTITVLSNNSYNFQFEQVLKKLGFVNLIPLYERKKLIINSELSIERYPTTGIDNMLIIKSEEGVVMNYNDCNIPRYTRDRISKKIGKIDILLTNFNSAGKIIDYPIQNDHAIKKKLKNNFADIIKSFHAKYTIPFASYHYYRASESAFQNSSLMDSSELIEIDKSVLPCKIGDEIIFNRSITDYKVKSSDKIVLNKMDLKVRDKLYSFEELKKSSKLYCKKINESVFNLTFWIPALTIYVTDIKVVMILNISKNKLSLSDNSEEYQISSTSQELFSWWNKPYGTDSFMVGGHFTIDSNKSFSFRMIILLSLLLENKLHMRSLLKMLFNKNGILFLLNRREEVLGLIFSENIKFGDRT